MSFDFNNPASIFCNMPTVAELVDKQKTMWRLEQEKVQNALGVMIAARDALAAAGVRSTEIFYMSYVDDATGECTRQNVPAHWFRLGKASARGIEIAVGINDDNLYIGNEQGTGFDKLTNDKLLEIINRYFLDDFLGDFTGDVRAGVLRRIQETAEDAFEDYLASNPTD